MAKNKSKNMENNESSENPEISGDTKPSNTSVELAEDVKFNINTAVEVMGVNKRDVPYLVRKFPIDKELSELDWSAEFNSRDIGYRK